jgi:hypothetical protein
VDERTLGFKFGLNREERGKSKDAELFRWMMDENNDNKSTEPRWPWAAVGKTIRSVSSSSSRGHYRRSKSAFETYLGDESSSASQWDNDQTGPRRVDGAVDSVTGPQIGGFRQRCITPLIFFFGQGEAGEINDRYYASITRMRERLTAVGKR